MSLLVARHIGLALSLLLCFAVAGYGEQPAKVSVCQIKKDPASYNHKLLEVTGFVSHGLEDFGLFDPSCPSGAQIWLEYGGTASSGTIYCCGVVAARSRPVPAVVEKIPIPLVDDGRFREFDRLIQRVPDTVVRAAIVGRFFSRRAARLPSGGVGGGYGHMGCCTLLAIQQVLSVDPQARADLDYRASPDQPDINQPGCGFRNLVPLNSTPGILAEQQQGEHSSGVWRFTDPQRVVSTALSRYLNMDAKAITGIRQIRKSQGQTRFEWKPKGKRETYWIIASRPYWLSFYAKDPHRVAWVIVAAYESSCD